MMMMMMRSCLRSKYCDRVDKCAVGLPNALMVPLLSLNGCRHQLLFRCHICTSYCVFLMSRQQSDRSHSVHYRPPIRPSFDNQLTIKTKLIKSNTKSSC